MTDETRELVKFAGQVVAAVVLGWLALAAAAILTA